MTAEQAERLQPDISKQVAAAQLMAKELGVPAIAVLRALAKAKHKLVPPGHVQIAEHAVAYAEKAGLK